MVGLGAGGCGGNGLMDFNLKYGGKHKMSLSLSNIYGRA